MQGPRAVLGSLLGYESTPMDTVFPSLLPAPGTGIPDPLS